MSNNSIIINIIQYFYDFFYEMKKLFKNNKVEIILSGIFLLFTYLMYYIFTFNPNNILESYNSIFIIMYFFLMGSLIPVLIADKTNKMSILKNYFKVILTVFSIYILFRVFLFVSRKSFVSIGKFNPFFAIITVLGLMGVFYKTIIEPGRDETKPTSNYNIFIDIVFYLPCLFYDGIEYLKKDVINANTSILIITCIAIYAGIKYVFPFIKSFFIPKDKIKLLSKPSELSKEVLFIDQEELKNKIIENRPYLQRQILKMNYDVEKLIKSQDSIFSIDKDLFDINEIYGNKQIIVSPNSIEQLKDQEQCKNAKITCDSSSNKLLCNGNDVIDYYGMYAKCSSGTFTATDDIKNNLSFYLDVDKTRQYSLSDICKFDNDISNHPTAVGCYNYNDISGDISYNSRDDSLTGETMYVCNITTKNDGDVSEDKYKVIYAYNDIQNNKNIIKCSNSEGFSNIKEGYNSDIHRLDVNLEKGNMLNLFSQEENDIIKRALNDDESTLDGVLSMYANDPTKAKAYVISYFANNKNYMSLLNHINNYNLESRKFLNQEISDLIQSINRINNISHYNYHYCISFWIYFDSSILSKTNNSSEGLIMNYEYQPMIIYDYTKGEIVIKIKNCDDKSHLINECNSETVYRTDQILYQKWNNFIINYNYGTLDIFINNNLVSSTKSVAPYISDNDYYITFGSEEKPLNNCAICNVEYYEFPVDLKKINNIYKNNANPCK